MPNHKFSTYLKLNNEKTELKPNEKLNEKPNEITDIKTQTQLTLTPKATRSWFYANELATIYNIPQPTVKCLI